MAVGAFSGGRLAGFARLISDGTSDGYVQDVVVHPEFRRQGIGGRLVRYAVAEGRKAGLDWIGIVGVPGSEGFYRGLGLTERPGHTLWNAEVDFHADRSDAMPDTKEYHFANSPEVCSESIDLTLQAGRIASVHFNGGCPGSLAAVAVLVRGKRPAEAAELLSGICCGEKSTSCPDQLAQMLKKIITENPELSR